MFFYDAFNKASQNNKELGLNNQVMPVVAGKHFRCECGCNVFTKFAKGRYKCNACSLEYASGKADPNYKSVQYNNQQTPHDINELFESWKKTMPDVQHVWGAEKFIEWVQQHEK